MKIVLDTNVLINGFKDDYSYEKKIIDAVIAGEIEAYANKQTLRENKLISNQLIHSSDYQKELNDLLSLEKYQKVKIVNPGQFWTKYKDEGMDLWKQLTSYIRKE